MGCPCTRLPRSADWSCLEGTRPDAEQARRDGVCRTRMRCRHTGLVWEVGYAMDREPEPFSDPAPESFEALRRLVDDGAVAAGDLEVGRAAERAGCDEVVVERLGRVVEREGPRSDHRYAWVRACRRRGRWAELVAFLPRALASGAHDGFDLESLIHARFEQGTLGPDLLALLRDEVEWHGPRLQRRAWPAPPHVSPEPGALSALAPLLLADGPEAGLDYLRERAEACDLSLQLPLAWAFLSRARGGDIDRAIELLWDHAASMRGCADRPWEAALQPLFWLLWPAELHASAAEVVVAAGARSIVEPLRFAAGARERMVER